MTCGTDIARVGRIVTAHGGRWAVWTDQGLVAVGTTRHHVVATARAAGITDLAAADGASAPRVPDWRYLPGGFRGSVLRACMRIPSGEVATYADLARAAGSPGAARAAGSAVAGNPMPVIIPCHRVVRSDGHLGAYSMGGAAVKARMLRAEGVSVQADRITG